jgi:hypothetical protein
MWNSSGVSSGRLAMEKSRGGRPSKATLAYWPAEKSNGPPLSTASRTMRMSWVVCSRPTTRQVMWRSGWATVSFESSQRSSASDHGTERQASTRPCAFSASLSAYSE